MNIGEVVKGIFVFLFEDATNTLIEPLLGFLEIVALSPDTLMEMKFLEPLFNIVQKIGAAILILITTWQGLKAMLVGLGFEADEPQKIAVKTFVAGFLIYYIKDILMKIVEISSGFITLITDYQTVNKSGLAEIVLKLFIGGPSGTIYTILVIILIFKLFGLMYKMFKRLAMCALLIICSPLPVATMVSKVTEGFMQGFVKLFAGNIAIQIIQTLCMVVSFMTLESALDLFFKPEEFFFSIMLTIAFMSITGQLEDILRDLSMSVGINRDMQGALGKVQGMAYTASMLQGASKFIRV